MRTSICINRFINEINHWKFYYSHCIIHFNNIIIGPTNIALGRPGSYKIYKIKNYEK